jgi:phage tail-like protein
MASTADGRSYVAGKYATELDGIMAGWVFSAEGGYASAEVVNEKVGSDHITHKHVGGVKYDDISVSCGTGMSKGFYDWIKASFDHNYVRKNGAVITANYNYQELSRLTFFNSLITEIGFPALDASSKDPAKMTIKWSPEYTRTTQTSGPSITGGKYSMDQAKQKKWLTSNFRLRIDGLDEGCAKVNKIDAITVKQKVIDDPVGELRDYAKEPAHLEVPNLVVTLPEAFAQTFYAWHEDFVIKGNNGDDKEKGGTLEYLAPNLQEVLFSITFSHLGIFKLTPEKVEGGSEQIRRVKAEMYCEDMKFDYRAAWA